MASISPFNILLNNLSSDLSKLNLHNLVNVCGELISEVERERISSGWDVFNILIRRNAIGEEPRRIAFLLRIIKELRPKRRDLVSMVKNFIEDNYDQPQEILDDFESSSDDYRIIQRSPRPVSGEDCCINIRCGCCSCNLRCNHCCTELVLLPHDCSNDFNTFSCYFGSVTLHTFRPQTFQRPRYSYHRHSYIPRALLYFTRNLHKAKK